MRDARICAFMDNLRILPIVEKGMFSFAYEIIGVRSNQIAKIHLEIIGGQSSFVDYLVFFQEHRPTLQDIPRYLIEETKTDDSESPNTGVYQRITKFVMHIIFIQILKKLCLLKILKN